MLRLTSVIVTDDSGFRNQLAALLRLGGIPVRVSDDRFPREGVPPDVVVVDGRNSPSAAMQTVERVRVAAPAASIFFVAEEAAPDLILHSMRGRAKRSTRRSVAWPRVSRLRRANVRKQKPWCSLVPRAASARRRLR